jgi:hypothetical protein
MSGRTKRQCRLGGEPPTAQGAAARLAAAGGGGKAGRKGKKGKGAKAGDGWMGWLEQLVAVKPLRRRLVIYHSR